MGNLRNKQTGFSLIELLIVVAIILIIAAIAIPNLMRAKMAANDSSAAASMRSIVTAEIAYYSTYPTIGYTALASLGGAIGAACVPGTGSACFIDSTLANDGNPANSGKSGYKFLMTPSTSGLVTGLNDQFLVTGTPLGATTGSKAYCAVDDGVIRTQAAGTITVVGTYAACQKLSPLAN
jgi:type IV pilus assembly protein PilA